MIPIEFNIIDDKIISFQYIRQETHPKLLKSHIIMYSYVAKGDINADQADIIKDTIQECQGMYLQMFLIQKGYNDLARNLVKYWSKFD